MANSKIYLGSTNIGSIFQGADDISIYLGDEKVYPLGEPTFQGKWLATYSDSHTESADCDASSAILGGEIVYIDLVSVEIGDCVTSIGDSAFEGCSSLTSITVNATTPPTLGFRAFDDTNNCPIYVPCESLNAYKSASGWSDYADRIQCIQPPFEGKFKALYSGGQTHELACDSNTTLTTGETKPSGYEYSAMTEAIIGDCVRTIGVEAFSNCSSLTSIDIPDSVTLIGSSAFMYCFGLTSCTIGNSVTTIDGNAFNSCSGLTNINIPNSVTIIGGEAFRSCSSLTSVTISNSVTEIGYSSFSDCTSLTSIVIPDSVTSIGQYAFWYCSSLTSITIEASVPPTLDTDVFYRTNNCPIYVPSQSVNTYKTTSGWSTYASRIQAIPNS